MDDKKYVPSSRRGVLHLCPIPRNMRPVEIQSHFNRFGEIRRMKFVPYPKKERWPGGPLLPPHFREGWMEFTDSASAKRAAETMNGQAVDVKRLRKCYGELWVVKYLGDAFSWDSLIEEKEEKRRLRRASEVQARRTERDANEAYRRLVFASLAHKSKRKSEKRGEDDGAEGEKKKDVTSASASSSTSTKKRAMKRAREEEEKDDVAQSPKAVRTSALKKSVKRTRTESDVPKKPTKATKSTSARSARH